jgi:CDP-paratose 2-epimerase
VNGRSRAAAPAPYVLVTGGAGFVGVNVAKRLLHDGAQVRILDSLARPGSEDNIHWLDERFRGRFEFVRGDVRDAALVREAVEGVDHVVHLAAQVAVTTSLVDPLHDFDVNARGTINVLEAARGCRRPPSIAYSSTNKVYGVLPDVQVRADGQRYVPVDDELRACGVGERRPLDFHSPYGCSKGAAEQYVLDWSRSYGLRTVVLRMSCIYGPHQNGNEDQGWVAHFLRSALEGRSLTIYGDGLQVRDVLFVDDLVDAFEQARRHADRLAGRAFNVGGGVGHTLSLLELLGEIRRLTGRSPDVNFDRWRVGDQKYYVSDVAGFREATGWTPRVGVADGLRSLLEWLQESSASSSPWSGLEMPAGVPSAGLASAAGATP